MGKPVCSARRKLSLAVHIVDEIAARFKLLDPETKRAPSRARLREIVLEAINRFIATS